MNHSFEIIPLTVEARGEIIVNNLPEFRELVREALGNINRDLKTDEDFEHAEKDIKALKFAEDAVRAAAIKAFDDKIKALVDGLNETAEEIRMPRLELEKLISKRKDEAKSDLVNQACERLVCAPHHRKDWRIKLMDVCKGKRSLDSMAKALEQIVEQENAFTLKNRAAIETFCRAHGAELVPDADDLEIKSIEAVEAELRRRFESKKALEKQRELQAEAEAAKAELQATKKPLKGILPPCDLPPPPKIGTIQTGPSPRAEWENWMESCRGTFAVLKVTKDAMRDPENVRRASAFSAAVNAAWIQMRTDGKEEA